MGRSIRIFLASLKSEVTRKNYLKVLERFKQTVGFESFDNFVLGDSKAIQKVMEDYLLEMRENIPKSTKTNDFKKLKEQERIILILFKKVKSNLVGQKVGNG